MSVSANLFKLQRIDMELDTHYNRSAEIAILLESDEEVQRTKKQQESAQAAITKVKHIKKVMVLFVIFYSSQRTLKDGDLLVKGWRLM